MQWLEIDGKYINLDNIAFVSKSDPNLVPSFTTFAILNFIGGQSLTTDMEYTELLEAIKDHYESFNLNR